MIDESGLTEEEKQSKVAEFLWDPQKLIQKLRDEYDERISILEGDIIALKAQVSNLETKDMSNQGPVTRQELDMLKNNIMKAMFTNYDLPYPYGNIPQS